MYLKFAFEIENSENCRVSYVCLVKFQFMHEILNFRNRFKMKLFLSFFCFKIVKIIKTKIKKMTHYVTERYNIVVT